MDEIKPIEVPETPITDDTFIRQGWEKHEYQDESDDGDSDKYYYWVLPLPKDNPDEYAPCLISSANDEWEVLELNEGEYMIELANTNGLGVCGCEEEIDILYNVLTGEDINND